MDSLREDYNMTTEDEVQLRLIQINGAIVLPMIIKTAIELNLFEIMAKTPNGQFSSLDLASSLPTQTPETPGLLERILRFLASQSVLTMSLVIDESGSSKKLYSMTPLSNHYVGGEDETSHASKIFMFYDKVFVDCWYYVKDAVVEGGVPFNKAHGANLFEYFAKDNRFNQLFNKALSKDTCIEMKMILEKYNGFEGVRQLVDVGGGLAANLDIIVSKYPNIKGINFDLPHVIKNAPTYPGVEHVGGNMFESVPKGDAIFMKSILHDWGDDYCIMVLKNCWAALPASGKVVVVTMIIPDPEHTTTNDVLKAVMLSDMFMLLSCIGGKERTIKEYNALAKEAGFTCMKVVCWVSTNCIMEFYKNA